MADEMIGQIPGVVFGTVDEARFSSTEEGGTEVINARRIDHTPVVAETPELIEHWQVDPGQVRAEAGRPNDCLDLALGEVDS